MATEIREASVRVVLDTKGAIEQAERSGEELEKARKAGEERGAKAPGTETGKEREERPAAAPGWNDPSRWEGERRALAWGRSVGRGQLEDRVLGALPKTNLGPFSVGVETVEAAAKYGPGFAAGLGLPTGGEQAQRIANGFAEVRSRLSAIGETQEQLKDVALLQAKLGHGINPKALAEMARRLYRVNQVLDQGTRQREQLTGFVVGRAVGKMIHDTLFDATQLQAGR